MLVNQQGGAGMATFAHAPLSVDVGMGMPERLPSGPNTFPTDGRHHHFVTSPPLQPSTPPLKQGEDPLWQRRAPGRLQLQSLRLDTLGRSSQDAPSTHPPPLGNNATPGVGMHVVSSEENLAAMQWQQQQQQQLQHQHHLHQHHLQQQQHQHRQQMQHQYQHMYLQLPPPQHMGGSPLMNPVWTEFVGTVLSTGTGTGDSRKRKGSFEMTDAKRMFT
uniref:Uncharacterized protein n=2 Tax=Hemiselmis andersenii TaxID=464988 RepID=A0A6T8HZE0_HEMAN|mmetsp:Transcript_34633/g.81169  ORF Transcript_34633/g.81169 Transcript_34633/m.81169 type:complete len:217 (+) Transcript_34633:89-739(+)